MTCRPLLLRLARGLWRPGTGGRGSGKRLRLGLCRRWRQLTSARISMRGRRRWRVRMQQRGGRPRAQGWGRFWRGRRREDGRWRRPRGIGQMQWHAVRAGVRVAGLAAVAGVAPVPAPGMRVQPCARHMRQSMHEFRLMRLAGTCCQACVHRRAAMHLQAVMIEILSMCQTILRILHTTRASMQCV